MQAYDYNKQCWVEGEAGTRLLLQQSEEDLALLESDRGEAYARMVGCDRVAAIDCRRQDVKACRDALAQETA